MNLQSLTAVLNLIALIGGGAFLFTAKTDSVKYDDKAITARVADVEGVNLSQDTLIREHEKADEKAQEMLEKKLDRQEAKIDALLLDRGLSPKGVVGDIPAFGMDDYTVGFSKLSTTTHE